MTEDVHLRDVIDEDLPIFFEQQKDSTHKIRYSDPEIMIISILDASTSSNMIMNGAILKEMFWHTHLCSFHRHFSQVSMPRPVPRQVPLH